MSDHTDTEDEEPEPIDMNSWMRQQRSTNERFVRRLGWLNDDDERGPDAA